MHLINAHWEKRNLGLSVAEVSFEKGETIRQIDSSLFKEYDYIVAKVPSGEISLLHDLEKIGFRFLESQFDLSIHLKDQLPTLKSAEFLMKQITTSPIDTPEKISALVEHITPDLFEVDRISIDPEVGKDIGAQRYKNWVLDEFNRGNIFSYQLELGATPIGFFILKKQNPTTLFAMLAGLFSPFKNKGLGLSIVQKPIDWAKENNYSSIVTRNSSNNSESFKIHLACGYKLNSIYYLLRWKRTDKLQEDSTYVDNDHRSKSIL